MGVLLSQHSSQDMMSSDQDEGKGSSVSPLGSVLL